MHKVDLGRAELEALLEPLGRVGDVAALTGGMFASTYRVGLEDGTRVVVKASGTDPGRLCRYERGIARTEASTFATLAAAGLPVPMVLLTDFGHEAVAADVVVTSHLPGRPWNLCDLDDAATRRARRGLGALMARLHRVPAPDFGYPAPEAGMLAADWPTAFVAMVEGILADAVDAGASVPATRVRSALARHGSVLEVVSRPVVVHNDLWSANVFLDEEQRIVGLIDTERTVWGDGLLDLVGADQLGLWDVDPEILAGNASAGGDLAEQLEGPTGRTRFALYRLCYSLILVVEISVRGYMGEWVPEHRRRAEALVEAALERLGE